MKHEFNFEPFTIAELESAPRPEPEELLEPIIPVPEDAPQLEFRHAELGAPTKLWTYTDAESRLIGYIGRFENTSGEKTFFPLTYCRSADGNRWRAQGFKIPYPLYNLAELLAKSALKRQTLVLSLTAFHVPSRKRASRFFRFAGLGSAI